jgi:hypothetical protein
MPIPYTNHPPHKLILNDDGTFTVNSGDCLSKYNWAIHGNWGNKDTWSEFARPGSPQPVRITPDKNQNLIYTGETLIYMPRYKPQPAPNPPGTGGPSPAPPGWELNLPMYEKSSDLISKGPFLVQVTLTAQGSVATKGISVTAGDKDKLAQLVCNDVANSVVSEVDRTATMAEIASVANAVRKMDLNDFNKALGSLVSYTVMKSSRFQYGNLHTKYGVESSLTPAVLGGGFSTKGIVSFQGTPVEYSGSFIVTVKIGLSADGWKSLIKRLGKGVVRAFVRLFGSAAAATIAAWCGFVLLGAVATLGFVYLYEWMMEFGRSNPYAPIYAKVYADSVFYPESMNIPQAVQGSQGEEMVVAAIRDVIADMQSREIEVPQTQVPSYQSFAANPAGFWKPNRSALKAYEVDATQSCNGDERTAYNRIYFATLEKAEKM